MECLFKRQETIANTAIQMEFEVLGIEYLVKNFTDGDVYIAFGKETNKKNCLLIPAECSQIVTVCKNDFASGNKTITIIPESTSEKGMELQCLRW